MFPKTCRLPQSSPWLRILGAPGHLLLSPFPFSSLTTGPKHHHPSNREVMTRWTLVLCLTE